MNYDTTDGGLLVTFGAVFPRAFRPAFGPGLAAAGGSGGGIGAYDSVPSIAAAYGMRRLLTAYTGSLLRLRRGSDNAEQDVTSTGAGHLDTAAIATWLGGNSGYVRTWYDQSGGGNNAIQTTAASQPLYVASGQNGRPVARFDGVDDHMQAAAISGSAASFIMANTYAARFAAFDTKEVDSYWRYSGDSNGYWGAFRSERSEGFPASMPSSGWHVTSAISESSVSVFVDSVSKGTSSNYLFHIGSYLLIGAARGGHGILSNPLNGDISELVIANAAWTAGQRQTAEAAANSYWAIY